MNAAYEPEQGETRPVALRDDEGVLVGRLTAAEAIALNNDLTLVVGQVNKAVAQEREKLLDMVKKLTPDELARFRQQVTAVVVARE
jgi:hypothetical protein